MQFTVPQFIEKEMKILGPLGFKQTIYLIIAGIISIVFYFTLPFFLFAIFSLIIMGGGLALAFFKIEKIPLPEVIKNLAFYIFQPKTYLWEKKHKNIPVKIEKKELEEEEEERKRNRGKLSKTLNNIAIK